MRRVIRHSELDTALECQGKHAFAYTGHLTGGDALEPRQTHVRLREGRAWGRAVAAFHMADPALPLTVRYSKGVHELDVALREDEAEMAILGLVDYGATLDAFERLTDILWHYVSTSEPLCVHSPEYEVTVPVQARDSYRQSSRYSFQGHFDGLTFRDNRMWIVEYKLRGRLTPFEQVVLTRQFRRYAWALEQQTDRPVGGIIVDERLNEAPKPARLLKNGKPSHAKDQLTTPEMYLAACEEHGEEPHEDTLVALKQRRWQARHPIVFSRREIEEAGRELVSGAKLIGQLDRGDLYPMRNPSPFRCPGCAYREICPRPDDTELVDLNFVRKPPKRLETVAA